jgi:hypothetical protein
MPRDRSGTSETTVPRSISVLLRALATNSALLLPGGALGEPDIGLAQLDTGILGEPHQLLQLRQRMHQPIPLQGTWLRQVVTGFFAYHAVPTNFPALAAFRLHVARLWRRTLRRRSQKDGSTWKRIEKLADDFLPKPRIHHPWPSERFAVKHLR